MVKHYMGRSGWKRPDGLLSSWSGRLGSAGVIPVGRRKEIAKTRVLVCWVLAHIWWQDLRGLPALGLLQDLGTVEGLTTAILLQLIMVDNFGLSSGALLNPVD